MLVVGMEEIHIMIPLILKARIPQKLYQYQPQLLRDSKMDQTVHHRPSIKQVCSKDPHLDQL